MNKTKFTSGEWRVSPESFNVYSDGGNLIAVTGTHITAGDERKANAALIASAPELYMELQEVSNYLRTKLGMGEWENDIEKLLAKARGES